MASIVLQNQYLMGCIKPRKVLRRRTTDPDKPDKPQWTYTVGGGTIEVCSHTFLSIHGLKPGKLREIMKQKKHSKEDIAHPDMRGKSKFGIIIFIDDNVKYIFK